MALAVVSPLSLLSQGVCGESVRISTTPTAPKQGTLFLVRVAGASASSAWSGKVAGEALHFHIDSAGTLSSYAPAPIDSSSLGVAVVCEAGAQRDTVRMTLALSPGTYPLERLRVPPRFSTTPDSALLARQRREAALAAAVSAASHDTPRLYTPPFARPRPSQVTSRFGRGRTFNGLVTSRHMGTDFAGAVGAVIRSTNRGIVRLVDDFFLGGKVVYVDHGAGIVSAYLHMSAQRVAVGDTVERGTVLGLVGASGRVTGPHLHFIVRYGGVSIDPQSLVGGPSAANARMKPPPRRSARSARSAA